MDNYPAGVTGNEFAIAGADREWDEKRAVCCNNQECADLQIERDVLVSLSSYGSQEWGTFTCPTCGTEGDYENTIEDDEGGNPDYLYETRRDEF